jgi:hypothetical protein
VVAKGKIHIPLRNLSEAWKIFQTGSVLTAETPKPLKNGHLVAKHDIFFLSPAKSVRVYLLQ